MNYIDTETGLYPVTEQDIRQDFPNTAFPQPFAPPDGFAPVFPSPQPAHDPVTENVVEAAPELTGKGHYEQRWEVAPASAEDIALRTAPPPVPHAVSARQIRLALLAGGLLDDLETAMAGMSRAAQIEWEFAGDVLRDSPLVEEARVALGRTQEQVDDLFRLGATL